jgi:hypothetical protein
VARIECVGHISPQEALPACEMDATHFLPFLVLPFPIHSKPRPIAT